MSLKERLAPHGRRKGPTCSVCAWKANQATSGELADFHEGLDEAHDPCSATTRTQVARAFGLKIYALRDHVLGGHEEDQ